MEEIIFEPSVNPGRGFLEIASDFSNPSDIIREAISIKLSISLPFRQRYT